MMAQKKIRISWRPEGVEKTFLETCINEMTLNGLQGGSLKPASWKNIAEKLKTEHNFIVEQRQMKNRYDYLKGKFGAWNKLKSKTGNVYNPVTNTFNLSEEEWQIEMKSNKYVEGLRSSPLPYPDLCVQLFEGSTSNGFDSWGPSSTLPRSSTSPTFEELPDHNLDGLEHIDCTQMEPPTQNKEEKPKDKENKGACCSQYQQIIVFIIICWYWLQQAPRRIERVRDLDSTLTGDAYTQELLHGSSTQCHEMMRVTRDAFVLLCNHFRQKNWLQSSRSISLEEKLAMFFIVIGHNERFRMVKRRFQHSTETIHRCFHEVLSAMMNFATEVIVPASSNAIANTSERHRKLKQIFPGAIGALDGTLVHAVVPADQQTRYRGRGKGECFQNVIGICDFDMIFTFVWAGWEGIAHDSRVLKEVVFNPNSGFPFPPPDKYYLCDAAYTNTREFMTPYRNTRYWLADFRRRRALTKEEKFNHAHTQLRNVIERAYGVLKARFPILKQMAPYSFQVQRDVVIACFAVHNFIRKCNIYDPLFMDYDENTAFSEIQGGESGGQFVHDIEWGSQGIEYMTTLRNQIATQLISSD